MKEERFDFDGIKVHYYSIGDGLPILMLHGTGPGASSIGNWNSVMEPLGKQYKVYAMDLVGFGRSERKPAPPYFDFDLWLRQISAMMARIPGTGVGVIAHSLSASLALTLAAENPRIAAVLTTGAMGAPFEINDATLRTWTSPRNRQDLLVALGGLIHDVSGIDEDYLQRREQVLYSPGYADYFDTMFGGDKYQYVHAATLPASVLSKVKCPVVMLHGLQDRGFPPSCTEAIAEHLPNADVCLLNHCSHSVAVERSSTFLALANDLFERTLR
jgi:2-hydroxymuconate-semialdehyde hydrolase